jgi:predicted fused transcriptional regulator/phosphomethylpyrimidine kinase
MLKQRVERLEGSMERIEAILQRLEPRISETVGELRQLPKATDHASLKADVARIDGRLTNIPTMWQMLTMVISTWAAGSAIVFALLRLTGR